MNERLSALGVGLFISSADGVKVSGSKAEGVYPAPRSLWVFPLLFSKPLELSHPWYDSDWVILVSCGVIVLGAVYFLIKRNAPVADPTGVVSVEVMRSKGSLTYDFHLPSGNSVAVTGSSGKNSLKTGCDMAIKPRSTKRNFCSSGEGESSDSSDSDTCFSERWKDHLDALNTVASSLKEGGLIRDEHLKELKSVGSSLTRTEIPDLDEVVKDAAQARISRSQDGTDKAAAQVQNVLSNIEVARNAARFLEHEMLLDKGPRKRFLPGEGEARAAELGQLLENQILPTLSNVISAYRDLRQASVESDSENSIHSDADSGGGEGE